MQPALPAEAGAYEHLWLEHRKPPIALNGIDHETCITTWEKAKRQMRPCLKVEACICDPAAHGTTFLYGCGDWDLLANGRRVSVIGSRRASSAGLRRAAMVAEYLCSQEIAVVSGMASGIDFAAHNVTIATGGRTVAVMGTPFDKIYPNTKAVVALYSLMVDRHLVVTHVPWLHHAGLSIQEKARFFPARNVIMSALSEATIIVEASEHSGTRHQARAAIKQGKRLLILNNVFSTTSWATGFEEQGALRIRTPEDLRKALTPDHQSQ